MAGDDGELATGDQIPKDLLDAAPPEASSPPQGHLIRGPLAALIAREGHCEQNDEMGSSLG
jgi:hypothetical protein